jgi:hypothetical protein
MACFVCILCRCGPYVRHHSGHNFSEPLSLQPLTSPQPLPDDPSFICCVLESAQKTTATGISLHLQLSMYFPAVENIQNSAKVTKLIGSERLSPEIRVNTKLRIVLRKLEKTNLIDLISLSFLRDVEDFSWCRFSLSLPSRQHAHYRVYKPNSE